MAGTAYGSGPLNVSALVRSARSQGVTILVDQPTGKISLGGPPEAIVRIQPVIARHKEQIIAGWGEVEGEANAAAALAVKASINAGAINLNAVVANTADRWEIAEYALYREGFEYAARRWPNW